MNCGRKWRGISKIHHYKIIHSCAKRNSRNRNIRHLIHRAPSDHLHSKQSVAVGICDQLRHKNIGIRIIMRLVIRDAKNRYHVESCRLCLHLRKPRARRIHLLRKLYNPRAKASRILCFTAAQIQCQRPSRNIGSGTHRRPLPIPCNTVFYKCTVTNGVNIRKVRPLKLICNNQSPLHRKSRIRQKIRGRADTHGKNHQLRRQIPHLCPDTGNPLRTSFLTGNLQKRRSRHNAHSLRCKLALNIICHIRIKNIGHQLIRHIHHCDRNPLRHQILRHLKPDKTPANNHGALYILPANIVSD